MEGILLMLLYLVFGFFKNRTDKMKRKKIQSDPNWDSEMKEQPSFNFDNFLDNILDDNRGKKNNSKKDNIINNNENLKNINYEKEEEGNLKEQKFQNNTKTIKDISKKENLKEKKLNVGSFNKNKKSKINLIFKNKSSIKKAIILKEILDKPLGLR